jgi:Fe2+ or Zn2+ uptake regulation protein
MNHTVQRDAILKELRMSHEHPSADRLYEILRKKLPQISLGTVYRNLEQMAKMGTIRKLTLSGHQKRFDGDLSHHFHVRCPRCDMITNIKVESLFNIDNAFKNVIKELNCENYCFELTNMCEECKEIAEAEKRAEMPKKREVLSWR